MSVHNNISAASEACENGVKLLNGKFLSCDKLMDRFSTDDGSEIIFSNKKKEKLRIFTDNSENIERKRNGKRLEVWIIVGFGTLKLHLPKQQFLM
jgi:hypothetical protein